VRIESSYFWPDEKEQSALYYRYRFDSQLVASATQVPTAYDDPIPKAISEGIRRAANPKAESVELISASQWTALVDEVKERSRRGA